MFLLLPFLVFIIRSKKKLIIQKTNLWDTK